MLLPGAAIIINTVIVILFLLLCAFIGVISAIIFLQVSPLIYRKAPIYKRMITGAKVKHPWWTKNERWASIGWWIGFIISSYCLLGPAIALTKYIGGL